MESRIQSATRSQNDWRASIQKQRQEQRPEAIGCNHSLSHLSFCLRDGRVQSLGSMFESEKLADRLPYLRFIFGRERCHTGRFAALPHLFHRLQNGINGLVDTSSYNTIRDVSHGWCRRWLAAGGRSEGEREQRTAADDEEEWGTVSCGQLISSRSHKSDCRSLACK